MPTKKYLLLIGLQPRHRLDLLVGRPIARHQPEYRPAVPWKHSKILPADGGSLNSRAPTLPSAMTTIGVFLEDRFVIFPMLTRTAGLYSSR